MGFRGIGSTECELLLPLLPQEEKVGERRLFGTLLSGSLPARASRGEREPGFDRQFVISLISIAYWNEVLGGPIKSKTPKPIAPFIGILRAFVA